MDVTLFAFLGITISMIVGVILWEVLKLILRYHRYMKKHQDE